MAKPLYFRALRAHDAKVVANLERKLFATELRDGEALLEEIFTEADQQFCNLSFGLFAGKRLVGYLVAYIELESVFGDAVGRKGEEVVYLRGLAVLPGYRSHLLAFIRTLVEQMSAYCPGAPVEVESVPEKAAGWAGLQGLIRRYGYALSRQEPTQEQAPGIMLQGLRWEMQPGALWLPDQPLPLPRQSWATEVRGRQLSVTVVNNPRQWLSLRTQWDDLLRATPGYTVFQSFDYLLAWWRHFGAMSELRILVISEADAVVGIAPLAIDVNKSTGLLVRNLGFIGAPWQVDRAQFLFGGDFEDCLGAVFGWLSENKDTWDICSFYEQIADAPLTASISLGFRDLGCVVSTSDSHPCPYLELNDEFNTYLATRSRKLRQNLRRSRRQLEEFGAVSTEIISDWPGLEQGIERYTELERRSWKPANNLGIGRDKADDGFYRWLARVYGEAGDFQLRFLKVDERDVAATFGICFEQVFYSLMIVHDQQFDRCSPGTLLEAIELEECFSQDLREYDMLGGYVNNKLRWTSSVRTTVHQHFVQRRPRPLMLYLVEFVMKPGVKRLLERAGLWESAVAWKQRIAQLRRREPRPAIAPDGVAARAVEQEDPATSAGC